MTQIVPTPISLGVAPQSPTDAKALACVFTVFEHMRESGDWCILRACEATGVERWLFYQYWKRPIVQTAVSDWLGGAYAAVIQLLEKSWPNVVSNMISIATSRSDEKAAVSAGRLLKDILAEVREYISHEERGKQESEASLLMKRMQAEMPKIISAKRRIVEETVEFEQDGGEIVEGEFVSAGNQ